MKKLILIILMACGISYCSYPKKKNHIDYDNLETYTNDSQIIEKQSNIKDNNGEDLQQDKVIPEDLNDDFKKSKKVSTNYSVVKDINSLKFRFNRFCRNSESSLRIRNIRIENGNINNTFQYMFNDNLGLIGTLNKKDNSIREITMIGQGDGSLDSGVNLMIVMGAIISSVSPNIKANGRGEILKELGFLRNNVDINNLEENTIRGEIKYWVNSSKYLGIMFGASHIQN